jgi:Ca2+-binding EF-hand superfamily protein
VVRQLSRFFDSNPHLRPPPTPLPEALMERKSQTISLSKAQDNQILEIFQLFDTDGGGTIDRRELELAMTVLGFQIKKHHRKENCDEIKLLDTLVGDGTVTLEEFSALMRGEVSGIDPYEEAQIAYSVLSRPDEERNNDNLITFKKLEAVCREYEVWLCAVSFCSRSSDALLQPALFSV